MDRAGAACHMRCPRPPLRAKRFCRASFSPRAIDKVQPSVQVLKRRFPRFSDTGGEFCMRIASKCVAGWLVVTALACASVICGQEVGAPPTPPKPKTVEITPTNIQAHVGDKIKFTAVAKDDAGKTIDVKPMLWIALPPDIAGADADGT